MYPSELPTGKLAAIHSPADLRRLSGPEVVELAAEIRDFIVASVAKTGGHLGSNLGAVELTLALHRVFESPKDAILWDTGHQAYVHKLVTGRAAMFSTLRQENGLSGYPNRAESEHDFIENSHASTVLSYAYGMAVAREHSHKPGHIVAVLGDGSMTGGMAYEAINNLGASGRKVIIVLNDNGRSYAPTVSLLSKGLTKIRLNPVYMERQHRFETWIKRLPMFGGAAERAVRSAKAAIREMWEPPAFFEALGVRYTGPIDGHDIEALEEAFTSAMRHRGPIVVHVHTNKGQGYQPALDDEEKNMHDASPFDVEQGPPPSAITGYTEAFSDALIKAAEHDTSIRAITAAMPGPTGLIPFQERFPDQFIDVGIAEQHAITAAAGMAMGGLRPVVAIYSTFINRAWDNVVYDVALHKLPVVICLDRAGITGDNGPSHHGVYDLALMIKVPGMTVFAPSSVQELALMLHDALEITTGPVCIRWPNGAARHVTELDVGSGLNARLCRSHPTASVAILAVGKLVGPALEAATLLSNEGIEVTVWDVRCPSHIDPAMVADAARHLFVLTAEDGIAEGGVGAALRQRLADVGAKSQVEVAGLPTEFIGHATPRAIHARYRLDAPGLAARVNAALRPE